MPTYEYLCTSCGHKFEKFQSMNDEPLKKCPQCGKEVKRIIGIGLGVILKGGGSLSGYQDNGASARTCCGRTERCDEPPCTDDGVCKR